MRNRFLLTHVSYSYWSYEISKRALMSSRDGDNPEWMNVLLCGGIAGVITWASVFPLGMRRWLTV